MDESNRFEKEMRELIRNIPEVDVKLLKEFQLTMEKLESIPSLPSQPKVKEEPVKQPIPLRLLRQ